MKKIKNFSVVIFMGGGFLNEIMLFFKFLWVLLLKIVYY